MTLISERKTNNPLGANSWKDAPLFPHSIDRREGAMGDITGGEGLASSHPEAKGLGVVELEGGELGRRGNKWHISH